MKPGDKVRYVDTPLLIGAWVRRHESDYTIIPGGAQYSNVRVRSDDSQAIEHVAPAMWPKFTIVALPPVCPDTPFDICLEIAERRVEAMALREQREALEALWAGYAQVRHSWQRYAGGAA